MNTGEYQKFAKVWTVCNRPVAAFGWVMSSVFIFCELNLPLVGSCCPLSVGVSNERFGGSKHTDVMNVN
jgi:hypothetical protein